VSLGNIAMQESGNEKASEGPAIFRWLGAILAPDRTGAEGGKEAAGRSGVATFGPC